MAGRKDIFLQHAVNAEKGADRYGGFTEKNRK